jgi:hypothetical protein
VVPRRTEQILPEYEQAKQSDDHTDHDRSESAIEKRAEFLDAESEYGSTWNGAASMLEIRIHRPPAPDICPAANNYYLSDRDHKGEVYRRRGALQRLVIPRPERGKT